jgi:hypothetical protein
MGEAGVVAFREVPERLDELGITMALGRWSYGNVGPPSSPLVVIQTSHRPAAKAPRTRFVQRATTPERNDARFVPIDDPFAVE